MADLETESYDIFISYAEPDNRLPAALNGWVKHLYDCLPGLVQFHLGRAPRVYFANETAEANRDWTHIAHCCTQAKVFIAVASPNYLARAWPLRELDAYVSSHRNQDGLFVVALTRVGPTDHPVLGTRTHSAFYQQHPYRADETAEAFPVRPDSDAFQDGLFRLAASIARYLKSVSDGQAPSLVRTWPASSQPAPAFPHARVLLAQPSGELEQLCDSVRSYFEQFGIEVVAASDFSQGGETFRTAFTGELERATHFVQLFGPRRGRRPPDLPDGYVVFQAKAVRDAGIPVMQWRSLDLEIADNTDSEYEQLLHEETVVVSTLEEFKQEACRRITAPPPTMVIGTGATRKSFKVFVNAELADRDVAERIKSELREYSVFHPDYDVNGSNQEITLQHLRDCRALIVLYGHAGLNWVNAQINEALKYRGNELPGGAVCIGPPTEKRPLNFSVPDIVSLDCRDGNDWSVEPIRRRLAELSK